MKQYEFVIGDGIGLHARPAGLLSALSKKFKSEILITKADKTVNAAHLLKLMSLGAKRGDRIRFSISGSDEDAAYDAVSEFCLKNL